MTAKKIHNKLEQLINSLIIKENHKTFLRRKANELYNDFKYASLNRISYGTILFSLINSNQYTLERFWYGGSFDREIFIKNRFDIDIYFVYKENKIIPWVAPSRDHTDLTGRHLFELISSNLKKYQSLHSQKLKLLKNPPYRHAIPIRMDYKNILILFDCIPAIEKPSGYLIIPNGMEGTKKVKPNLEEQALSKLNKMQNGKITKLILLTKYWNFNWGKPLKGYVIERLVECIFDKIEVHTWDKAVKTFFSRAIYILDKKKKLSDRVYTQYSILNEYSNSELNEFLEVLREAVYYTQEGEWKELFHDI